MNLKLNMLQSQQIITQQSQTKEKQFEFVSNSPKYIYTVMIIQISQIDSCPSFGRN